MSCPPLTSLLGGKSKGDCCFREQRKGWFRGLRGSDMCVFLSGHHRPLSALCTPLTLHLQTPKWGARGGGNAVPLWPGGRHGGLSSLAFLMHMVKSAWCQPGEPPQVSGRTEWRACALSLARHLITPSFSFPSAFLRRPGHLSLPGRQIWRTEEAVGPGW